MKRIFVKNYDKLILLSAILILSIIFMQQLSTDYDSSTLIENRGEIDFWDRSSEGVTLQSYITNDLMPGDFIFYKTDEENFSKIEISKVFFKRRSEVFLSLKSGKTVSGKIKAKEGVTLSKSWSKATSPLLLDADGKVMTIQLRQIERIMGNPEYILDDTADLSVLRGSTPFFYQRLDNYIVSNHAKRPEWGEIVSDKNNTIYDLFTPPLIYLIENKLTTSLPDAPIEEEEVEAFGASIVSFDEIPYRFRLVSWIGNSPYIEDTKLTKEFGKTTRNRLEVNHSYSLVDNPKPGRPSLTKVDNNSSEKLITLKYFTVQNVTQKNGGVKPVGRALVEDHSLGAKPFEMNSLMDEVFLGQFEVKLRFKIGKEDEKEIALSDNDEGKEMTYNGRKYTVLGFDAERKAIKLRKQGKLPHQFEDLELLSP